jgi:hypothetical protein
VADQSLIEFYGLATQVIPVLWIGAALQRLDPEPVREKWREIRKVKTPEAYAEETIAAMVVAKQEATPRELGESSDAYEKRIGVDSATAERMRAELTNALRSEPLVPLAILAITVAAVSEALALYGVASARTGWFLPAIVTMGLLAGGALLLIPLVLAWMRIHG